MTGWRLGWVIARADLTAKAAQLNEFVVSHPASFIQKAAETALNDGEPEILAMLERLRANRDFCMQALSQMPRVKVPRPEGAFYCFPRIEGLTDSFDFLSQAITRNQNRSCAGGGVWQGRRRLHTHLLCGRSHDT